MHYRVIYLAIHRRETMRIHAPNAAAAVAMAERTAGDAPNAFELLSVAPEPEPAPAATRHGARRSPGPTR
jgi:hypothetical protein